MHEAAVSARTVPKNFKISLMGALASSWSLEIRILVIQTSMDSSLVPC
jgi:hypothetical protein